MQTPFETAARAAIEEMLSEHSIKTKHGYVLTEQGYEQVINEFYRLLKTSRQLKEKGDRLIAGASGAAPTRPTRRF